MANFEGWLIKIGDNMFPHHFILEDGWHASPSQRMEWDTYRNANGKLIRDTVEHTASKITLNIKPLRLEQKEYLDSIISLATLPESDRLERKVVVTYWNDEILSYVTGVFYMPDIEYNIKRISEDGEIIYKAFDMKFIEY